ncbi:MAG: hypothetical protein ACRENL_05220 [Candidatus Dormibacteria bacterium]
MTWARFDDGLDEALCDLSHEAFRLYVAAVTYNRRRQLGGCMGRVQSCRPEARGRWLPTYRGVRT